MMDRITLFGSRDSRLQPSRNGEGAAGWLAVSPRDPGAVGVGAAKESIQQHGGLLLCPSGDGASLDVTVQAADGYTPPTKALLVGDAGPSWVELESLPPLGAEDHLIAPEDRDAQDGLEGLRTALLQLPEDRQGLIWAALGRPATHYRLSRLEEAVRALQQAPQPALAVAPVEPKSGPNWLLAAAGTLLGIALGFGLAGLSGGEEAPAPEAVEEAEAAPLPVLTFPDLDRLDLAIQDSPNKDALLEIIGPDTKLSAMNQQGFVALAKLELHRAAVDGLAAMSAADAVAKLGEVDLGPSRPQLLAQYYCEGSAMDVELPAQFPSCDAVPAVSDIRQAYFNLLDFIQDPPAP